MHLIKIISDLFKFFKNLSTKPYKKPKTKKPSAIIKINTTHKITLKIKKLPINFHNKKILNPPMQLGNSIDPLF